MRKPRPIAPGNCVSSQDSKARLAQMLRVDHAGEMAAVEIYKAQKAVFAKTANNGNIYAQLDAQEKDEIIHKAEFDKILVERGIRPTIMAPIWKPAAWALGTVTALMGEKAAHACTEAVEAVIEDHYLSQEAELGIEEVELRATIAKFREEETKHKDDAIAFGAKDAIGYPILSAFIKAGCRAAIAISQRV